MSKRDTLPRRTFLKGLGTAMALPVLDMSGDDYRRERNVVWMGVTDPETQPQKTIASRFDSDPPN